MGYLYLGILHVQPQGQASTDELASWLHVPHVSLWFYLPVPGLRLMLLSFYSREVKTLYHWQFMQSFNLLVLFYLYCQNKLILNCMCCSWKQEGAFAQLKVWQSASTAVVFFLSPYISLKVMLLVMLVALGLSYSGFLLLTLKVEKAFSSRSWNQCCSEWSFSVIYANVLCWKCQ